MLEFNPLYCKKKPCVKMSFNLFLFKCIIDFFFVSEVLHGRSYSMKGAALKYILPDSVSAYPNVIRYYTRSVH